MYPVTKFSEDRASSDKPEDSDAALSEEMREVGDLRLSAVDKDRARSRSRSSTPPQRSPAWSRSSPTWDDGVEEGGASDRDMVGGSGGGGGDGGGVSRSEADRQHWHRLRRDSGTCLLLGLRKEGGA
jgi:hypothetical protein